MGSPRSAIRARTQRISLIAYRIADGRFKVFDGTGALLQGGRWNSPGTAVIYACSSFAGAMLERLVHAGTGRIPKHQKAVVITIPSGVSREEWDDARLPAGWEGTNLAHARRIGDDWLTSRCSAVLVVPSAVARHEKSILINPAHRHFDKILASAPEPVRWDSRLFGKGPEQEP